MPIGDCLVTVRLVLLAAGVFVLFPLGVAVALGLLGDLGMLLDAFGWWGVAIFLAPTVAILTWSHFHGDGPPRF